MTLSRILSKPSERTICILHIWRRTALGQMIGMRGVLLLLLLSVAMGECEEQQGTFTSQGVIKYNQPGQATRAGNVSAPSAIPRALPHQFRLLSGCCLLLAGVCHHPPNSTPVHLSKKKENLHLINTALASAFSKTSQRGRARVRVTVIIQVTFYSLDGNEGYTVQTY